MGKGIASWPSNSLLIPSITSVITITLSLSAALWAKTLLTKRFADADNAVNSMLGTTQCKESVATMRIIFPRELATVWTVLAFNNTDHQGCWPGARWEYKGVFETLPGERYSFCFICLCQRDWLLLEAVQLHTQSGLNHRHTAGRTHANWASLALCQGFMRAACEEEMGWGWVLCARIVLRCVHLRCTLICITPFICGQGVASCSNQLYALSKIEPSTF